MSRVFYIKIGMKNAVSTPFEALRLFQLGIPLLDSREPFGVFSVMRRSHFPFKKDEMNVTKTFAELMSEACRTLVIPARKEVILQNQM